MTDIYAFGKNWEIPAPLREKLDQVVFEWVKANPNSDAAIDARTTALENATKDISDSLIALGNANGATINATAYGADPTGKSDSTDAINRAAKDAEDEGKTLVLEAGTYRTSDTVTFLCPVSGKDATIRYYGGQTAVVVGSASDVTYTRVYDLPSVFYLTGPEWDGHSIGVDLVNLNTCTVRFPRIRNFETGMRVYGASQGSVYNNIFLGYLDNNHVNLLVTHDEKGWSNENAFYGGRFAHTMLGYAGCRGTSGDKTCNQVVLRRGSSSIGGPNNNVFIKPSLEGSEVDQYRVVFDGARHNMFVNARWETTGALYARVSYLNNSDFNTINHGYGARQIIEEFDATSRGGVILDQTGGRILSRGITADQTVPPAVDTRVSGWTNWGHLRASVDSANSTFVPRAGDWSITVSVMFDKAAGGLLSAALIAGTTTLDTCEATASSGARTSLKLSGVYAFSGDKEMYVRVRQDTKSNLNLLAGPGRCSIHAVYLGA